VVGDRLTRLEPDGSPEPDAALVPDLRVDGESSDVPFPCAGHHGIDHPSTGPLTSRGGRQDEVDPSAVSPVHVQLDEPDRLLLDEDEVALDVGQSRP